MKRCPGLLINATILATFAGSELEAQPRFEGLILRSIEFDGASWISRDALGDLLGMQAGEPFSDVDLARGVTRLLGHYWISSATPTLRLDEPGEGVRLHIAIETHQEIASIDFVGHHALSTDELEALVRSATGDRVDRATFEHDREAILERYHADGYLIADVEIEQRAIAGTEATIDLVFSIEEGHRVAIRSIQIEGASRIPARHVLAAMKHRARTLFGFLSAGYYRPKVFDEDLERIRELYRNRGYLDARVSRGDFRIDRKLRALDLSIIVAEGPRYRIEAIEIGGGNPALDRAVKFQIRSRPGEFYDGKLVEEDRRRILDFYQRESRRIPVVEVRHIPGRGTPTEEEAPVRIAFDINERPRVFAGRVRIEGNRRTRDHVIRRRVDVFPGSPVTRLELQSTAQRIRDTGLFKSSTVRATSSTARRGQDVTVDVEEKPEGAGLFEIGGGASSGEGEVFAIRVTQPNFDILDVPGGERGWEHPFSGGGQLVQIDFFPGTKVSEFRALFEEPHFYNSYHTLSASGTNQIYRSQKFDENHLLFELGLSRTWDSERHFSTRLSWVLGDVSITDVDDDRVVPNAVRRFEGRTRLSYPSILTGYWNAGANYYSGSSGLQAWTRVDLPLSATGSETDFVRSTTTVDWAARLNGALNRVLPGEPLNEDSPDFAHTLHARARFGWMKDVDGDVTPFFERFFPGGPRDFPGFSYRGLGPRESGVPLGGNALWQVAVEYSFPLWFREVRAVGRFDAGDVEERTSEFSIHRTRAAAGGGVQLRLRLFDQPFPLNFYWMEALRKRDEDRDRLFTFSLGWTF